MKQSLQQRTSKQTKKTEGVTATEEEIDKEIKELAAQYGMDEKAVRSALSDDMLNHDISIRKVVDEITDSAKQVEKD